MAMLSQSHKNPLVKPRIANSGIDIPVVDLSCPHEAKKIIVDACQDYGFFKVINHSVPIWLVSELENEAIAFFNMNQSKKDTYCPPNPFGYGSNIIGRNGDVGRIEYLLLSSNNFPTNRKIFS
ncbi:gibberellin 2-beta-dioxygenase, partial [Tanacetum coccineum]